MPARPERAEKLWARLGELENLLASEVDVPRDWRRRALLRLSEEIAEEAENIAAARAVSECLRMIDRQKITEAGELVTQATAWNDGLRSAIAAIQRERTRIIDSARSRPSPREPAGDPMKRLLCLIFGCRWRPCREIGWQDGVTCNRCGYWRKT